MRFAFALLMIGYLMRPIAYADPGKASFLIGTNAGFEVKGEKAAVESLAVKKDGKVSGTFGVNLRDFKTGMSLRDTHLCDTLECDKYPKATFKLSPIPMEGKQPFSGTLSLHGVEGTFTGEAEFIGPGVKVKGKIRLSDYKITPPNYKLIRLDEWVQITIEIPVL